MRLRRADISILAAIVCGMLAWSGAALAGPAIVFDVGSGKVLKHEDAFKRWYPASLTKLMTAYVSFRAVKAGELRFDSPVRISQNAAKEPPSKMGYKPGSELTLDNALKILMVKSANDIATAVAESVGGSEQAFAARMNAEAARLGMSGTHYVNAHGLHSTAQYTTARDLALLVRALRLEFPQYAGYFAIEAIDTGDKVLNNYNVLIGRFPGADGMKTGFICAAGFNLIASATRDNRTLAAVVLGAQSQVDRAVEAAELLTEGFKTASFFAPTLDKLKPDTVDLVAATDMRPVICNNEARQERAEDRDEEGRLVLRSRFILPMNHEPRAVAVGLGGADGPVSTTPRYANVPIPTPRPQRPRDLATETATAGAGG